MRRVFGVVRHRVMIAGVVCRYGARSFIMVKRPGEWVTLHWVHDAVDLGYVLEGQLLT